MSRHRSGNRARRAAKLRAQQQGRAARRQRLSRSLSLESRQVEVELTAPIYHYCIYSLETWWNLQNLPGTAQETIELIDVQVQIGNELWTLIQLNDRALLVQKTADNPGCLVFEFLGVSNFLQSWQSQQPVLQIA